MPKHLMKFHWGYPHEGQIQIGYKKLAVFDQYVAMSQKQYERVVTIES